MGAWKVAVVTLQSADLAELAINFEVPTQRQRKKEGKMIRAVYNCRPSTLFLKLGRVIKIYNLG